ncbi:hypothetical protein LEN26_012017 [Aphanomyces euteiches]|nr:hypothetical protein AeMF1_010655 [Aphanomyces euteiches]KAH9118598.1 hypothetical protein LEN26_012017 [Aphanomyces euteiches]KAH9196895.1 hypothetical protein AeNC1_001149 [Aphanomyces euteiches]
MLVSRRATLKRSWSQWPRQYTYWSGVVCFILGFVCSASWSERSGIFSIRNTLDLTTTDRPDDPPTVLVTGGLGFIGSHVVEDLHEHGFRVVVFDDMSNGKNFDVARNASAVLLKDITHLSDFDSIPIPIDYVVHLAAAVSVVESVSMPEKYHRINVDGSRYVLEWAQRHKVKRVVAASTSSIYGDVPLDRIPLAEISANGGISPYATSKFEMEQLLEATSKQGLPTTALRIFNAYGPRQDPTSLYSGVVAFFMDQAMKNGNLVITGDGKQLRDFIYVKDVAVAVRLAMLSQDTGFEAFNICTGVKTTVLGLAQYVLAAFGSEASIEFREKRPADVRHSVCDPTKAQRQLGFTAQYSFEHGIAETWKWLSQWPRLR